MYRLGLGLGLGQPALALHHWYRLHEETTGIYIIIGYSRSCVAGAGCTRYIEPLQPRTLSSMAGETDVAEALAETSRQNGKIILPEDKTFITLNCSGLRAE